MAVVPEQVLPGFKRSQKSQGASAEQLPAGAFYRELLNVGSPEAQAGQVQPGTPQAVAPAPPEPAQQHASACAADAQLGAEQQVRSLLASDVGATAAASDHAEADATAGLGSMRRIEIRQPVGRGQPAGDSRTADTAFVGPSLDYGISPDNVGFQLLRKAGWQPGAGLGAESQGRRMPLEQSQQKGRQGLGVPTLKTAQGQPQVKQSRQDQQQADAKQSKLVRMPLPEDSESFDTKVKRQRQVLQAEADDRAGKAIQRYMYMAFNDTTGEATADVNPLLRRNRRLTATNPLL